MAWRQIRRSQRWIGITEGERKTVWIFERNKHSVGRSFHRDELGSFSDTNPSGIGFYL
jgi:tRNA threonylcarbamoyladenosine modification (KEOPS) complex Cgi121 subunit